MVLLGGGIIKGARLVQTGTVRSDFAKSVIVLSIAYLGEFEESHG